MCDVLSGKKRDCYVQIPGIYHTFYLNFNFTFKGSLDPSKPIYNQESEVAMMKGMLTNGSFITGLISTVSMFGMLSINMNLVLRIVRMYEIKKMIKEVIEMTK